MACPSNTDTIRRQIREILAQHGVAADAELCESLLIQGGFFCGRRFSADGFSAVWFVEENELKIYDPQGQVLQVHDLGGILGRHAA